MPPTSGPMTLARPNTPLISPAYLARSPGANRSPMTANVLAKRKPPPMPCSPRNTMSCVIVCDVPESADPARKMTTPAIKNSLRP